MSLTRPFGTDLRRGSLLALEIVSFLKLPGPLNEVIDSKEVKRKTVIVQVCMM